MDTHTHTPAQIYLHTKFNEDQLVFGFFFSLLLNTVTEFIPVPFVLIQRKILY
jgi:hypothetical protein